MRGGAAGVFLTLFGDCCTFCWWSTHLCRVTVFAALTLEPPAANALLLLWPSVCPHMSGCMPAASALDPRPPPPALSLGGSASA